MSGRYPIGFKFINKKLIPDEKYISTVETIFNKYLEFQSVLKLKNYLDENDIKSRNNNNFSKGNLYNILSNKAYIGLALDYFNSRFELNLHKT